MIEIELDPQTWQLKTERLILRAPQPGEGAIINEALRESFTELHQWMLWARAMPSVADTETHGREKHEEFRTGPEYAVRLWLPDGRFVGGSGLSVRNRAVPSFEIGYWCRTALTGQGYISETVQTLTEFAFQEWGAQRVEIRCDARNTASRRVAEKCGFILEGILKNEERDNAGGLRNTCVYARFPVP